MGVFVAVNIITLAMCRLHIRLPMMHAIVAVAHRDGRVP